LNALLLGSLLASKILFGAVDAATDKKDQDVASGLQAEGVEKAKYVDIERGFHVRLDVGMLAYVTRTGPAVGDPAGKRQAPGMLIGIELGYDILPVLDIGAFFTFAQTPGIDETVCRPPVDQCQGRDLGTGIGGAFVRFSFFHTERVFLGVKAGAGYGFQHNQIEPLTQGIGVPASLTIEYFTRIRHFSLALDAGALIWIPTSGGGRMAVGIAVTPAVKYTF